MSEQDDIRAMATRFFDAIESGDIETMQGSFTPDAEIWHNTDELIVTPAQTAQTLTGMASRIRDREYADRQLTVFPGGFVQQHVLKGVRVHDGDALNVLERLPDAMLERVYLLHPDPWPKARHAKRRFVNPGPLDLIAAKLKPGGEFRLATDHPVYMRWAVMQMARRDDFEWLAERASDWETRPDDWPATRYGEWAAGEGRPIWYFRYLRK